MDLKDFFASIATAWPAIRDWLLSTGIQIGITLVIGVLLTWLVGFLIKRALGRTEAVETPEAIARTKRLKTVLAALRVAAGIVIWVIVGITVLGQLGVAIGPILAALGVVGLAVGFGAQSLVKDFLAGIFLIVENQFRVGDIVRIGDASGVVEALNLRITQLRSVNGHLYTIPNGEIKMVENTTMKWSRAVVKVGVAYHSQIERVIEALGKAAADIKADEAFGSYVLETPQIKAIDDFAASSIDVALWIKTQPAKQWDTARMARRYIKKRFDEAGIEIPFPQVTLSIGPKEAELLAVFGQERRSAPTPPQG
ncbi:MAG: mechanosensitive ion channel family protein [Candidatus Stahlbacteria bacterium]|nr:MAG: mechanosensitive ion channel family protein [Candidatus Stahlbacteria bacterium]